MAKNKKNNQTYKLIICVLFAVIALVITYFLLINDDELKPTEPKTGAAAQSDFKFTGTENWRQGPTRKSDMALFHNLPDSCFVSVQYKNGTIDENKIAPNKSEDQLKADGYEVAPLAVQALTMRINGEPKNYELYQSSVTGSSGHSKILEGQESGHIQLPDGYIYIMGNCETPNQLEATLPALQAIEYTGVK